MRNRYEPVGCAKGSLIFINENLLRAIVALPMLVLCLEAKNIAGRMKRPPGAWPASISGQVERESDLSTHLAFITVNLGEPTSRAPKSLTGIKLRAK